MPENDLLDQLNGDDAPMPPLAPGEVAPAAAASRDAALTVSQPPKTAVEAANAKHATKSGGEGFLVVVTGTYYALVDASGAKRGKIEKPYSEEFTLPSLDAALSTIKNKLLDNRLRKKYPDFVGVRTHRIKDARPKDPRAPGSNNLQYMDRPALEAYVKQAKVPVDVAAYPETADLRDAVIDYTLTPKGFAEREAVRQKSRAEDLELKRLNPDT